jgi:dsRNA-specific ribonuclease
VDAVRVAGLERRLGYRFLDPALLERALTHASYAHEHPPAADHDRLAFLGDAVLGPSPSRSSRPILTRRSVF